MRLNRDMDASQLAKAFYQDALEKGTEDEAFDNLMDIRQIYAGNKNLTKFFNNRQIAQTDKEQVLEDLTKTFSSDMQNFIKTIYNFRRMSDLLAIVNAYETLYDHENRTAIANVTTTVPLTESQEKRIQEVFIKKLGARKVLIKTIIDEEILGGVIIEIENKVFDGSIRANLESLKKQLVKE
ncbi:MAG: ATP synthase F1 subunit delta [Carnobacterium sp.]|uniref:ATP synthase F1 subunit delta n=1 Tax=Carnobacterium sp. TaxID=48221 RepID=UPI002FC77938